jgi:Ion channel
MTDARDWTFTMSIRDDLNYGLAAFGIQIPQRIALDEWATKLTDRPTTSTVSLVTGAAVLFYLAERNHNERVRDIYDALVYCTTNISVGYCDIFAKTPMGKLIGSTLMTIGPAMATKTLDGPKSLQSADATQREMLETMKAILAKLEAAPPPQEEQEDADSQRQGPRGHQ